MIIKKINITLILFLSLSIGVIYFLFNLSILNLYLDLDIVRYYNDVVAGDLFHPHHLLYTSSGRFFFEIFKEYFGFTHSAMFFMQIYNLFISSFTIGFIFLSFYIISKKIILSFLFSSIVGFSNAYWFYSHVNDTPLIPGCFAIYLFFITFFILNPKFILDFSGIKNKIKIEKKKKKILIIGSIFIAIIHTLAIGFHQTNILIYPAIAALYLFPDKWKENPIYLIKLKEKIFGLLIYSFITAIFVSGIYIYAGNIYHNFPFQNDSRVKISGITDGGNFFDWLFLYGHWDKSKNWGSYKRENLGDAIFHGYSNFFIKTNNRRINFSKKENQFKDTLKNDLKIFYKENKEHYIDSIIILILTIFALFMPFLVLIFYKKLNGIIIASFLWFASYTILASWWEPAHFEFWLNPGLAFYLTLFLILYFLSEKIFKIQFYKTSASFIINGFMILLIMSIFSVNYNRNMLPRSKNITFGYWEDLYLKKNYTGLRNSIYRKKLNVISENPNNAWNNRMAKINAFRNAIMTNPKLFNEYKFRFENTLNYLINEFPDKIEIQLLKIEVEFLKRGIDEWMNFRKNLNR